MLPRHTACCRTVPRPTQGLPSSDSLWISDALLLSTFQRFCAISKGTRRHGSFVPGPLECRRRMGKRRIAYRADAGSPMFGMGEQWGWMGDIKNMSWRWQAPTSATTRAEKKDILITLPRWLASWPYPPDIPIPAEMDISARELPEDATFGKDKLLAFLQALSWTDVDKFKACSQFNHYIRQSLTIGSVNEELLFEALSLVTDEIHRAFGDSTAAVSQKLFFYQAVWGGISSCKILPLSTFQAKTMSHLLDLISALPISTPLRILVRELLACVSTSQLEGMSTSIEKLVKSWSLSWLAVQNKISIGNDQTLMTDARAAVQASEMAFQKFKAHITSRKSEDDTYDAEEFQQSIEDLRNTILSGIKAVKKCEASLFPVRSSITDLAHCLRRVDPSALDSIISSCTKDIIQLYQQTRGGMLVSETNIRISLLSLVSQLPNASQELFVRTWRTFDSQDWPWRIPEDLGCDLILSHMVSQGFIHDPVVFRNTVEAAPDRPTMKEYGFLLVSLYKQSEEWSGPGHLIGLLDELSKHFSIYTTLTRAVQNGLVLPLDLIRSTITSLATANPRIAFNLYNLCVPQIYSAEEVDLSLCPEFVISMIHDDQIPPKNIWKMLKIPIYERIYKGPRNRHRRPEKAQCSLPQPWIDLFTEMATAFSISKARPQRVAFRNVSQCLTHLRRHRVRISPEMSRAVSYSAITREILRENWIGEERLNWVLSIVEAGEGRQVRDAVEVAVKLWWSKMEEVSLNTRHLRMKQAPAVKEKPTNEWKAGDDAAGWL